ncbi:uncharacterized protein [Littorina saxatilis]|uniref:uncharacterized protein isoform X2 n=1 Tax=Littorina saxatilis TaxID=31220 RepID=UPI0038B65D0A
MAAQRVRSPALWGLVACLMSVTRPVAGDSFTLYLLQSSSICLAVSDQARAQSAEKCKNGFVLAWLADVTQLEELGTVLTSGVQYHVAVTYKAGGYEWGDGQPVDGALWASGVPSAGMCGAVQRSGSTRLTGVNCATKAKYICRNTPQSCSDETVTTQEPPVTSQSGDTVPPLTSQAQYRTCRCQRAVQTNATARAARVQEAEDNAERVRLDLTLVKHNLSSAVRTKTSARDDRWSARAAGGVSMAVLVLVCVTVIMLDLPHLAPLLASLTATVDISTDHTHSASSGNTDKSSVASHVANDTSLCTGDKKDDQTT